MSLHRHGHRNNDEADFRQLLAALGARRSGTGWTARCPAHEDRHPSLSINFADDKLLLRCFAGCDYRDVRHALRRLGLFPNQTEHWTPSTAGRMPKETIGSTHSAMKIWAETVPVEGTLGEIYLLRRGLLLLQDCEDVRFHRCCPRGAGRRQPALVCLLRDIRTNQPRSIQRRFLRPEGAKDGPAMSLGTSAGAVLKLSADEDVTHGLGIAEGHADALAVIGAGWRPCWATCGTGTMAKFPILDGVEALTIFCDANPAGRRAAQSCSARWRAAGREVRILEPLHDQDFGSVAEGHAT